MRSATARWENQVARLRIRRPTRRQSLYHLPRQRNLPVTADRLGLFQLALPVAAPDHRAPKTEIDIAPLQRRNLPPPQTGQRQDEANVTPLLWKMGEHLAALLGGEQIRLVLCVADHRPHSDPETEVPRRDLVGQGRPLPSLGAAPGDSSWSSQRLGDRRRTLPPDSGRNSAIGTSPSTGRMCLSRSFRYLATVLPANVFARAASHCCA